jgi:cytochrome b561
MAWRNDAERWGTVAKAFHWTMAILIVASSVFVLHVNDSTWWFRSTPQFFIQYIHWHKATGLILLVLVLARIAWRRRGPIPRTAPLTPFESTWSHRTHLAIYALMVLVPVSGWLASSFFGSPTKFFGLFTVPAITPKWKTGVAVFYWVHFVLSWTLLALVAVHAAAAIYHHVRRRDDVLRAMLPFGRPRGAR